MALKFIPLLLLMLSACTAQMSQNAHQRPPQSTDSETDSKALKTYVFECENNFHFVARESSEYLWVFLPEETTKLENRKYATPTLFANEKMEIGLNGNNATLNTNGNKTLCRNNREASIWERAKLDGVSFRAVGNEPGWVLEITNGGSLIYLGDYGSTRIELPTPEPVSDANSRITRYMLVNKHQPMEITIEGRTCQDSMADIVYPAKVTVLINEKSLKGCGRALH